MLSLNANWLREFRRSSVQPIFLVSITLDDSPLDVRTARSGPVAFTNTYPACVLSVSPFSMAVDVLERMPDLNEATVVFAGGPTPATSWARQLVVDYRLKGKGVAITWGTPNLAEADFEPLFAGVLDKVKVRADNSVEIVIANGLGILKDKKISYACVAKHPVQVVEDAYTSAGMPAALLDASTLDPAAYTTHSHFVLSRAGDIAQTLAVSAFELIADVAKTVDGIFVDTEEGALRFVAYDETKAASQNWTDNDLWDLEQQELQGNVITTFAVNFMHAGFHEDGFPAEDYEATDDDALANYAYPGTSGQDTVKTFTTKWCNGRSVLVNTNMTAISPAAGDTFEVHTGRAFAFCGTRWDGYPSGSQDADAQASDDRTLYVKIGSEIIEVDRVTVSTTHKTDLVLDAVFLGSPSEKVTQLLTMRVKARGALDTVAAAHVAKLTQGGQGDTVYDYTIPVAMAQRRLERFSNGCPIIHVKTALDKFAIQVGDFVTLTTDRYAAYGVDGLTTSTKWEVVAKEVDVHEDGCIKWTLAWVTGPVAPTPTKSHFIGSLSALPQGLVARAQSATSRSEVLAYRVLSGLTVSVVSGLDVRVAVGAAGNTFDRAELAATVGLSLDANKDHYIYFDTELASVGVVTVATAAAQPLLAAFQVLLAKGVAGGASVTLTDYTTDATEVLRSGMIGSSPLRALAVTEAKIASLAVTSGKIGANAVIAGKLADGAVDTSARLADSVVATAKIAVDAVTTTKIAARAVGHRHTTESTEYKTSLVPNGTFNSWSRG